MAQVFVMRPLAIGVGDIWSLAAGATKMLAVDPGNPVVHDDATSYLRVTKPTVGAQEFTLMGNRPAMSNIVSMQMHCRHRNGQNNASEACVGYAKLNGVNSDVLVFDGNTGAFGGGTVQQTIARPGGGAWTVQDIYNPTLQVGILKDASGPSAWVGTAGQTYDVTSLYFIVTFDAVPVQNIQARDVGSRRLLAFRRETARLSPVVPAEFLDAELLDEIGVAHFAHPLHNALGIGLAPWRKVPHRAMRSEFNLSTMQLSLELKDIRDQLLQFWDVGRSLKTSGPTLDGIARLDVGCARLWTRASKAWVQNPSDGLVHEAMDGEEKIEAIGMLFEQARTNGLTDSSFIRQLTGWTTTTDVTAYTAEPTIFEAGITGYVAKINTTPGADRGPTSAAVGPYSANARISVSVDYREVDSGVLKVRITRGVDGWFWNGSSWQSGNFNLSVTASTVDARAVWENIDVGGSSTTITVRPVILDSDARVAYIKHVQVEEGRWASSRIVTGASTVTRALDSLKVSNNSGRRCWNKDRGTLMFRYRRMWGSSAAATTFYLFDLTYDASNWFRVYVDWNGSAGTLKFEVRTAGTTVTASTAFTPAAATTYRLAVRWTSSSAELGLAAFTASVFVDGVKGTDVVASAMPTEASPSDLYIGGNNGATLSADGNVFDIVHTQQVLTDAEISRGF